LRRVVRPALADQHEHLLARVLHDVHDLRELRVVVTAFDLASVDPALVVAPLDHCLHGVAELVVEAGNHRKAGVVAVADDDLVVGDALRGRSLRVARAARRR
jgi:hypothetical protein